MASEQPKTKEELETENRRLKEGFHIGGTAKLIVAAIIGVVVLQVAVNIAVGFLHPGADNKAITDPINDSLNKVIAGLFAAGLWQVHKSVNSMKTELVEHTAALSYKEGQADTTDTNRRTATADDKAQAVEQATVLGAFAGRAAGVAEERHRAEAATTPPVVMETEATGPHVAGEMVAVTTPVRGTEEVIVQQKVG